MQRLVSLFRKNTVRSQRSALEEQLAEKLNPYTVCHIQSPLANALVCARDGREWVGRIVPGAEWIGYQPKPHVIFLEIKRMVVKRWLNRNARSRVLALQHRGLVVVGRSASACNERRIQVEEALQTACRDRALAMGTRCMQVDEAPSIEAQIRKLPGYQSLAMVSAGIFVYPVGSILPDRPAHEAIPFSAPLTPRNIGLYTALHGHPPRILVVDDRIYALGRTPSDAGHLLKRLLDTALIVELSGAFGGIQYLNRPRSVAA